MPASWAKALRPTIALFRCTCMPVIVETSRLVGHEPLRVDAGRRSGSNRPASCIAITTSSSEQLPARSPMPLIVHSICPAPFSTAARLLATARPRSLWQWTLITALSMFGTRFFEVRDRRRRIACGVA